MIIKKIFYFWIWVVIIIWLLIITISIAIEALKRIDALELVKQLIDKL
jgi:hypothetical protein